MRKTSKPHDIQPESPGPNFHFVGHGLTDHGRNEYDRIFKKPTSACCHAPVTVDGKTTHFYRCTECGKPCDT